MIKYIKLLLMLPSLVYCHTATAESNSNLLTKFALLEVAQGEFQQKKFFKVLNNPIESSGIVFFDIKQGFLWQTNFPTYSMMLFKPSGLYTHDGVSELQKVNGADAITQVLINAMSGNLKALESEFSLKQTDNSQCLSLLPNDDVMKKIILKINLCGVINIEKIQLLEQSGNRTEITLQLKKVDQLPEAISAQLK